MRFGLRCPSFPPRSWQQFLSPYPCGTTKTLLFSVPFGIILAEKYKWLQTIDSSLYGSISFRIWLQSSHSLNSLIYSDSFVIIIITLSYSTFLVFLLFFPWSWPDLWLAESYFILAWSECLEAEVSKRLEKESFRHDIEKWRRSVIWSWRMWSMY